MNGSKDTLLVAFGECEDTFLVAIKGSKDTLLVALEGSQDTFCYGIQGPKDMAAAVVAPCDLHIIPGVTKAAPCDTGLADVPLLNNPTSPKTFLGQPAVVTAIVRSVSPPCCHSFVLPTE